MAKLPAKYMGICQACFRLQKLPEGRLANHGYKVEHRGCGGYFQGVCMGSENLPYEESCELIKTIMLPYTETGIQSLNMKIEKLYSPIYEPRAWHLMGYNWHYCELRIDRDGHHRIVCPYYKKMVDKPVKTFTWLKQGKTLPETASYMNAYYADFLKKNDLAQLHHKKDLYMKAIESWKLQPLQKAT